MLFSVFGLLACSNVADRKISGEIDQNFINTLASINDGDAVIITSNGGDPDFGDKLRS